MASPSPAPPSPPTRKSFRSRVGTVYRRSSSFITNTSKASSTRSDSEERFASGVSSPAKPSSIRTASRAPSITSPEPPATSTDAIEAPPTEVPTVSQEPPNEPARDDSVKAPESTAIEPPAPAVAEQPVSPPERQVVDESVQAVEVPTPVLAEAIPSIEQTVTPAESLRAPTPKQSTENLSTAVEASTVEEKPAVITESPKQMPAPLAMTGSGENLNIPTELSPIQEDERSAVEQRFIPPFAPVDRVPKAENVEVAKMPVPLPAPAMDSAVSSGTDGTTPRAFSPPNYAPDADVKGKEREPVGGNITNMPGYVPTDSYFTKTAPVGVPQPGEERYFTDDPFRDPEGVTPVPASYVPAVMPEPETYPSIQVDRQTHDPFFPQDPLPLPPLGEVTSRNLRTVPSDYTLAAHSSHAPSIHHDVDTDETRPLLPRPAVVPPAETDRHAAWTYPESTFQSLGWVEYVLPDSRSYFNHPQTRVTTDIYLHNARMLQAVTAYLDKKVPDEMTVPPEGWEVWLRDESRSHDGFAPVRCWVNHGAKTLSFQSPAADTGSVSGNDDREPQVEFRDAQIMYPPQSELDLEYRYWSFMEAHPSHAPLPYNAYSEALDALTWSYTNRLLQSPQNPPLFTQKECQELLGVLRTTSGSESNVQAAAQTRIVARVLRRTVQWRQHHFRPEKPLPEDARTPEYHLRHYTNRRRRGCFDFFVSWLCFGIPYLFANRHDYHHIDEESGLARTAGPMLMFGATVCLVAAIILSASVTFLSLPGLDNIARTAGFVAIVGSIGSLASTIIALFRQQTEMQRMALRHAGEGIVITLSTSGGILMSLPAVFLAWSIVAFVTAIVLYAFRGMVVVDPSHWSRFAEYTKWTVVGVLGFSAGVLTTSTFFVRR